MHGRFPGVSGGTAKDQFRWVGSIAAVAGSVQPHGGSQTAAIGTLDAVGVRHRMTAAGSFRTLRATRAASPGVGNTCTYTLRVNGADTALTATMADPATTADDLVNVVNVNAGDVVELRYTITGGVPASQTNVSAEFRPT